MWGVIIWIVIGVAAGFAAGYVLDKDKKLDLRDALAGLLGSMVGGFLFRLIGFTAGGPIAEFIVAFFGAIVVLVIYKKFIA